MQLSDDEGLTWKWKRSLERNPAGPEAGSYHYPSLIQAADGSLHASYSYHLNRNDLPKDVDGDPAAKTMRHAHFNEAWVILNPGMARVESGSAVSAEPKNPAYRPREVAHSEDERI